MSVKNGRLSDRVQFASSKERKGGVKTDSRTLSKLIHLRILYISKDHMIYNMQGRHWSPHCNCLARFQSCGCWNHYQPCVDGVRLIKQSIVVDVDRWQLMVVWMCASVDCELIYIKRLSLAQKSKLCPKWGSKITTFKRIFNICCKIQPVEARQNLSCTVRYRKCDPLQHLGLFL